MLSMEHQVATSALKVFIDTEFTDPINTGLISLGMVAESGEEFYAEVPYLEAECSDFVRMAVIPLLGKTPDAICTFDELGGRILGWLEMVRRGTEIIEVCFDYQTDWDLLVDAIDYQRPEWCHPKLIRASINQQLLYEFHIQHALPKHHALNDARANRYAYKPSRVTID